MLGGLENSSFFRRRTIVGLEWVQLDNESLELSYCQLEKRYGKIKIKASGSTTPDQLKSVVRRKDVVLNISGKQVIWKKLPEFPNENIAGAIVPSAREQDFYAQAYSNGSVHFGGMIRKNVLDEILAELKSRKIQVVDVSVGPLNALEYVAFYGTTQLPTSSAHVKQVGEQLELDRSTVANRENITIDGTVFTNLQTNAFGAALRYHLPSTSIHSEHEAIADQAEESKFDQMKLILAVLFGCFLFFVLGTNLFLRQSYETALKDLEVINSSNETAFNQLQVKQGDLKRKQDLLIQNGIHRSGKMAYYADQIGLSIPSNMILLELDLYPLEKTLKEGERANFNRKLLEVTGVAKTSGSLNSWTSTLHQLPFVKEVTINNYMQDDRDYPGLFDLTIQLN